MYNQYLYVYIKFLGAANFSTARAQNPNLPHQTNFAQSAGKIWENQGENEYSSTSHHRSSKEV